MGGCFVCWQTEDVVWGFIKAIPFAAATGAAAYFYYKAINVKDSGRINTVFKKDTECVRTTLTFDELGDQACFCRCWKSTKFPYCDGSHRKHNQFAGDNVGPLIVKKKN